MGIFGAAPTSAAAAVGYCHGAHALEELHRGPLVSAGKEATGPGMANLGVCIRGRRVVEK